jgi:hypothetical protein
LEKINPPPLPPQGGFSPWDERGNMMKKTTTPTEKNYEIK